MLSVHSRFKSNNLNYKGMFSGYSVYVNKLQLFENPWNCSFVNVLSICTFYFYNLRDFRFYYNNYTFNCFFFKLNFSASVSPLFFIFSHFHPSYLSLTAFGTFGYGTAVKAKPDINVYCTVAILTARIKAESLVVIVRSLSVTSAFSCVCDSWATVVAADNSRFQNVPRCRIRFLSFCFNILAML